MMLSKLRSAAEGQEGFTLIELMIVVAIIGILAAVAVPNFIAYRDRSRVAASIATGNTARGALAGLASDDPDSLYPIAASTDLTLLNNNGAQIPTGSYTMAYAPSTEATINGSGSIISGSSYTLVLTHTATGLQVCSTPIGTKKTAAGACP